MVEIIDQKDNEDGSMDVTFKMTEEEQDFFTKIGIIYCIEEGIKATEGASDE